MTTPYVYFPEIDNQEIPAEGILSRTLYADASVKVVLFAFAAGQELSEHTAAVPATLQIVAGEAELILGSDCIRAHRGAWIHMPARLPHSVRALTPLVMLLVLLKAAASAPDGC